MPAASALRSRTVTSCNGLPETRIRGEWVFYRHLAHQIGGKSVRQTLVPVEMPVGVVGSKEKNFVGADLLDDPLELARGRWLVERLDRQPHMLADVIRGRARLPRNLCAHGPPGFIRAPQVV